MTGDNDWKLFINSVLINSGRFEKIKANVHGETEIETFKSTGKNYLTEIRVGYLKDNLLIYLNLFNPTVPGYNRYVEGEYFYQNSFNDKDSYGSPGLEFNEQNRNGILSMFREGLKGKEVQFIKKNRILKSILYMMDIDPNFSYSYDFTRRSFLGKLFGKRVDKIDGIEKREIDLSTIFSGIEIF